MYSVGGEITYSPQKESTLPTSLSGFRLQNWRQYVSIVCGTLLWQLLQTHTHIYMYIYDFISNCFLPLKL